MTIGTRKAKDRSSPAFTGLSSTSWTAVSTEWKRQRGPFTSSSTPGSRRRGGKVGRRSSGSSRPRTRSVSRKRPDERGKEERHQQDLAER
eukprot:11381364-Heterocapsa_arctica.AAC.1